jgi:hypothetical protein
VSGGASEASFSLLSRGDRVRGKLWKPAGRGPHPLAILGSPDGAAAGAFVASGRAAWSARAALVAFDFPLCGARSSGKISPQALERLRADLEAQTRADVDALLAHLAGDPELDLARVSLFGVGRSAELARGLAADPRFVSIRLEPAARELDPGWLR